MASRVTSFAKRLAVDVKHRPPAIDDSTLPVSIGQYLGTEVGRADDAIEDLERILRYGASLLQLDGSLAWMYVDVAGAQRIAA